MDFTSIIDNLISIIVGGGVGAFLTRKKYNAETAVTEGAVFEGMQMSYKRMVDDTNAKLDEMRQEIKDLHDEISKLRTELEKCMSKKQMQINNK